MKVASYSKYGAPEVLQIQEAVKPIPKDAEILIQIYCTSVTATEATFRRGRPYFSRLFTGLLKPKIEILGEEFSGVITGLGQNVTKFKLGEKVFGTTGTNFGAYAEYICLNEDEVILPIPNNLDYAEAAGSCDGFLTAYSFLNKTAKAQSGQSIMVVGACGSIGSAAVQIASSLGLEVTAVCSMNNHDLAIKLGAKYCIDYNSTPYKNITKQYDIIFDTVGKVKYRSIKNILNSQGIFLQAGITLDILPLVLWTKYFSKKKVKISATGLKPKQERLEDFRIIHKNLHKSIWKPVIDRIYSLVELSKAHEYVDAGHKKGNVVIQILKEEKTKSSKV